MTRRERVDRIAGYALSLGASLGTFGFFAVQGILLARLLGPEARGAFATAIMYPQALLYLGLLGAPELIAGYAAKVESTLALRRTAARYGLVAGLLSLLVCLVLDWLTIPTHLRYVLPLAWLCALALPFQQVRLAVQAVDHGQRQLRRYNWIRLLAAASFPVSLAVGFVWGARDLTSTCILFVVSQAGTLGLIQLGMSGSWFGPGEVPVRRALSDAKGLMMAWAATELLERVDLILMVLLIGTESTLGFYASAIPIAAVMIIIPNTAGLYAFNKATEQNNRLTWREARNFLGLGMVVQTVTGIVLALLLPKLILILYGEDFMPTVPFAWLLIPAGALRGLLQACDSYLRGRRKPMVGVKARGLSLPILVISSLLLLPVAGAYAIPISLTLAQSLCFVVSAFAIMADTRE